MGQVAQGVDAHAHQLLGGFAANTPKVGERVDLPEFRWHIRIAPAGLPRRRDLGFVIKREFRQEWILTDTHGGDDASRREDFILDGGGDGVIAAKQAVRALDVDEGLINRVDVPIFVSGELAVNGVDFVVNLDIQLHVRAADLNIHIRADFKIARAKLTLDANYFRTFQVLFAWH